MWTRRRRKGFELVGTVKPAALGLRKSSAARIGVSLAWREIAGPVLDEQTTVSLSRGLLDVIARGPEARSLIEPVLPLIAGRLAGRFPELNVRRWRLSTSGDESSRTASVTVEPLNESQPAAPSAAGERPSRRDSEKAREEEPPDTTALRRRLEAVSRRYLDQQVRRTQKP